MRQKNEEVDAAAASHIVFDVEGRHEVQPVERHVHVAGVCEAAASDG